MQIKANGALQVINYFDNAVSPPGTKNICDNNWHWIEQKFNLGAGTSVTLQLYVDGVLDGQTTAVHFGQGTAYGYMQFLQNNSGCSINGLDDIVIYDDNGNSPKDSDYPLGPRQIITLRPNGDSAVQFTPDTGATNYTSDQ
jgi:hypothetical protein